MRIILLLINIVKALGCIEEAIVAIDNGFIKGKCVHNGNREIYSFTSIPYAKPPIGHLRFKPPEFVPNWKNVLDATVTHNACPQYDLFVSHEIIGHEDCLYLNVYSPQIYQNTRYPVMIYFHAGAFEIGTASDYNPQAFLEENVVLVVPNYRLGALGFLSTGDNVVPGNNGLKDQNFVIKWVKRNIIVFGGNPDKITVFGQSAGGSSAHYHMLSPLSKGLINAAISESGVSTSIWSLDFNNNAPSNAKSLGRMSNCSTVNNVHMIDCLKKVSAYEIVSHQKNLVGWSSARLTPFRPVIEPNLPGSFISEHPLGIIKCQNAAPIPFMTGITTEDGAMLSPSVFTNEETLRTFNKDFDEIVPSQLDYEENYDKDFITTRIEDFYYNNEPILNSKRGRSNVTNMYTDRMFLYSQNEVIRMHLKYTKYPVYNYAFSFRGSTSYSAMFGDPKHNYGTSHADDTLYLFPKYKLNRVEKLVSKLLVKLWVRFATYLDPTPNCLEDQSCWEPVQSDNIEYLLIKNFNDTSMHYGLYEERMEFWEALPLEDSFNFSHCFKT